MKVALLSGLLLALPCMYQGNLTISRLIHGAEKKAVDGQKEDAATDLVRALSLTAKIETKKVRNELRRQAEKALKKIDRDHASGQRALRSAAGKMVSLSRKYAKRGWNETARTLATLADTLAPGSATKVLASLPRAKDTQEIDARQALGKARFMPAGKPWAQTESGLESPEILATQESSIVFAKVPFNGFKLSCVLKPTTNGGRVGILFDYRSAKAYKRLRLLADGHNLEVHIEAIDGTATRRLHAVRYEMTAVEIASGIPIRIKQDSQGFAFNVGKLQPRRLRLSSDESMARLGLWGMNAGTSRFVAAFAELSLVIH